MNLADKKEHGPPDGGRTPLRRVSINMDLLTEVEQPLGCPNGFKSRSSAKMESQTAGNLRLCATSSYC